MDYRFVCPACSALVQSSREILGGCPRCLPEEVVENRECYELGMERAYLQDLSDTLQRLNILLLGNPFAGNVASADERWRVWHELNEIAEGLRNRLQVIGEIVEKLKD